MKRKYTLVIPVLNMAYFLKGKPEEISVFFPELPTKQMTKKEAYDFTEMIRKTRLNNGRTYNDCFSTNNSKFRQVVKGTSSLPKVIWSGLDNTTIEEVAEAVRKIIDVECINESKEVLLLYITNAHERFCDVSPLAKELEDVVDDVLVYTDNLDYSSREKEKLGLSTNSKLSDAIREHLGKDKSFYCAEITVPYYKYFGAEYYEDGDYTYVYYSIDDTPYFDTPHNFKRRSLPSMLDK